MDKYSFTFIGQVIPQKLLNENFNILKKMVDISGNTFYTALLEGLAENDCTVSSVSRIDKKNVKYETNYNGIHYSFCKYNQNNIFRYISTLFTGFLQIVKLKKYSKNNNTKPYAVFNVLRISASMGALVACKILKISAIGVVTDVPGYRISLKTQSKFSILADKFGQFFVHKYDMYMLLSEEMKDVIRLDGKPYTIIEGIYDTEMENSMHDVISYFDKNKFNIVYAGSLQYRYGIMNLVKSVRSLNYEDIELHIYGSGEAEDELVIQANEDHRINFHGLIPRDYLLNYEKQASLLVNPRPVEDEYVKYSFPSKNMEYMASGTPVLLTNIPSLPDEYKKYVFLIESNDSATLSRAIEQIYLNQGNYMEMGKKARNFIMQEKTKKKQAFKLLKMIAKED